MRAPRFEPWAAPSPGNTASIDSPLVADAVVYNLLVIGEAVKNLGEDVRGRDSTIPWSDIAGIRDLLAHEYFRVDPTIIERTIRKDLVELDRSLACARRVEMARDLPWFTRGQLLVNQPRQTRAKGGARALAAEPA